MQHRHLYPTTSSGSTRTLLGFGRSQGWVTRRDVVSAFERVGRRQPALYWPSGEIREWNLRPVVAWLSGWVRGGGFKAEGERVSIATSKNPKTLE